MAELNLIPYSIRNKREERLKTSNLIGVAIIVLAVLFLAIYLPYLRLSSLQNKEASIKSEIDAKAAMLQERDSMLTQINDMNAFIGKVDAIIKNETISYNLIAGLQKYIPADVALTNLNYSKGTLSISGTSKSYNSSAVFAANLQETDMYKNAKLTGVTVGEKNTYTFSIQIKL